MNDFRLTPFELHILLHYLGSAEPFRSSADPELVRMSITNLADYGFFDRIVLPAPTEMARAWITKACATPLPVKKWVWE